MRPGAFALIIYGQVVVQTAFLSREPGSRIGLDTTLFSTWGSGVDEKDNVMSEF